MLWLLRSIAAGNERVFLSQDFIAVNVSRQRTFHGVRMLNVLRGAPQRDRLVAPLFGLRSTKNLKLDAFEPLRLFRRVRELHEVRLT